MAEVSRTRTSQTGAQWVLVLIGVLGIVAGIIVLAKPAIALSTLAVITGIFLLVDGIFETALSLVGGGDSRGVLGVILGLASMIVGVLLIRHPLHGVVAVALLLGLWLLISALVRFASVLGAEERRAWNMAVAFVELVAGIVIVSSPGIGVGTLALLVGISFILRGLALCAVGWLLPKFLGELDAPRRAPPSGPAAAT